MISNATISVWVARASRVLVAVSRRNNLCQHQSYGEKVRDREDAIASTRDACATRTEKIRQKILI
jgi:hypothetical protein